MDEFVGYFEDLRSMLEIMALMSVLGFIVMTVLGSVIAFQIGKAARALESRPTIQGMPPTVPPYGFPPPQYGPRNG